MDLKEAALLGDMAASHWYYRAKFAAIRRLLGAAPIERALDVGAGTGFFSRQLLLHAACRAATCVDPGYPADSDETVAGRPLAFRRDPEHERGDVVLLMDVLEHVADDRGLLAGYVAPAAAGTRFVITVPAFQWLWSGHDVFLEHHRRYTLPQIEGVCRAAGLQVTTGCYFFGLVLPLVVALRLAGRIAGRDRTAPVSQMRRHGALTNAVLWLVCALELPWFRANRLAGLSAVVLARKP